MEIFGWLLRTEMNKTDFDRVKVKTLTQHSQRFGWSKGLHTGPPTLKGPKQVYFIYPSLENFKKPAGKNYNEKPNQQSFGAVFGQNKLKIDKKARVPWLKL